MKLISSTDYVEMPWANGRGTTQEIVRVPNTDAWQWRLSLATVAVDGPFSELPGVERALVVAKGAGMVLTIDGADVEVPTHGTIRFSGDARVSSRLVDGPIRDLNLMHRRVGSSDPAQEADEPDGADGADGNTGPNLAVSVIERGQPLVMRLHDALAPITVLRGSVTMTMNAGTVPQMVLAHDFDTVLLDGGTTVTLSSPRGAVIATGWTSAAPTVVENVVEESSVNEHLFDDSSDDDLDDD